MEIDFAAREAHFLDHLAPTWKALPKELRGTFYIVSGLEERAKQSGVRFSTSPLLFDKKPVLVASLGDLRRAVKVNRQVFLSEHGAGQSYGNGHPSYSGGRGTDRQRVRLFLVPNEWAAKRNRQASPGARVETVGCPKLDRWASKKWRRRKVPTVAVSFHWNCMVSPESRWAYPHFSKVLPLLAERFRVLGHAHPRAWPLLKPYYERMGMEAVEDFDEVLKRADVYVCDNSSTIFEFAATKRPVVLLNAPWYRRHVQHGLRFWECARVGLQCDRPERLIATIERALEDEEKMKAERERITGLVYPHLGHAAERAAQVIREALG